MKLAMKRLQLLGGVVGYLHKYFWLCSYFPTGFHGRWMQAVDVPQILCWMHFLMLPSRFSELGVSTGNTLAYDPPKAGFVSLNQGSSACK